MPELELLLALPPAEVMPPVVVPLEEVPPAELLTLPVVDPVVSLTELALSLPCEPTEPVRVVLTDVEVGSLWFPAWLVEPQPATQSDRTSEPFATRLSFMASAQSKKHAGAFAP